MSNDNDEPESPTKADLERALRFLHLLDMQADAQVHETSATLYALIEELVAVGALDLRNLEARRERTRVREAVRADEEPRVLLSADTDKYGVRDGAVIDCAARIELCQARCCKLGVVLSRQDLDEGVLRWDYATPYQIRRRADDFCVHISSCGIVSAKGWSSMAQTSTTAAWKAAQLCAPISR